MALQRCQQSTIYSYQRWRHCMMLGVQRCTTHVHQSTIATSSITSLQLQLQPYYITNNIQRNCAYYHRYHNELHNNLCTNTLLQARYFSSQNTRRGRQDPDMRVCQSIEELTQMAYEHINTMSPRGMSAYWTLVSKLLNQRNRQSNQFQMNNNRNKQKHMQMKQILAYTLKDMTTFGYRDLAQTSISFAKIINKVQKRRRLHYGSTEQILQEIIIGRDSKIKQFIFREIASASVPILHEFKARELSNLIYAYGLVDYVIKFEEDGSSFFDMLAEVAIPNLHTFKPQHLSNTLWAYASAKETHPKLFKKLADHIVTLGNLNEFKPQELSNISWAFATAKESHPKLFKRVADHIVQLDNLNDFWPQALKDLVWAYATADESHPKLYKKVADRIITLDDLHDFKPQHLSNTVWAYAKTNESHPRLYKKVANHIVKLPSLDKFIPQHLSNILWAFATAGMSYPQLFKKMADHIISLDLNKFKPQHLSNIMWAFANAGQSHPQLFKKVGDHIITLNNLHNFKPQELSNTLWAYATAEESHPTMFKKVADHLVGLDSLRSFIPQHLSNIVWAVATAGESHPHMLNKLADEAIKRQHEFEPQHIVNFLWAFATNGQVDKHLFSSLVPSVKEKLDKYNAQELANVAWAYSVANDDAPSAVFNEKFIIACLKKKDEFELEALLQLHQWQLWREEIKSSISLPSSLQKRCYEAFISVNPRPSKLQDDVLSILSSMGLQPQEEVLMNSGYRIDAVVEVNGKQIAVEVDGPFHFIGREPNGGTLLKNRQVSNLDEIQVISIPYWEWNEHKYDNEKKEQYLRALLGFETN